MLFEKPVEMQYEITGNYISIYDHLQIHTNKQYNTKSIYILTTAGRVIFHQQIEQAIVQQQSFSYQIIKNKSSVMHTYISDIDYINGEQVTYTPFPPVPQLNEMWLTSSSTQMTNY